MVDFENINKNFESCTVKNITFFELNCGFLILIFNESFMDVTKWQHIKNHRGVWSEINSFVYSYHSYFNIPFGFEILT